MRSVRFHATFVIGVALTLATALFVAPEATAQFGGIGKKLVREAKVEGECLAACDIAPSGLKDVCLSTVKIAKSDKGCWNDAHTQKRCCEEVAKNLQDYAKALASECGGDGKCTESGKGCLNKLPTDPKHDLKRCVVDAAAQVKNAAASANACDGVDAAVLPLCKSAVAHCVAKEGYRLKDCVEKRQADLKKVLKARAICAYSFKKDECEGNWKGCHAEWHKENGGSRALEDCLAGIAGAFGKAAARLAEDAETDLKNGGTETQKIDRSCEAQASGSDLNAAEKAEFTKLCQAKRDEVKAERVLYAAEDNVRNLVGRSFELAMMLEQKAVLSLNANAIALDGSVCSESIETLAKGRNLAADATIKVSLGGYKSDMMAVSKIRERCAWITDNVEVFRKAIAEENKKYVKEKIDKFCGEGNCKGKAQKKAIQDLVAGEGIKVGVTNQTGTPS